MAIGGSRLVNRAPQVEFIDDFSGGQLKVFADKFGKLRLADSPSAAGINSDRHRLGDADGVRELHFALISQASGHDVLRDVASHVSSRAIDFGRILARERAATVRRITAIGIDDNFAAG